MFSFTITKLVFILTVYNNDFDEVMLWGIWFILIAFSSIIIFLADHRFKDVMINQENNYLPIISYSSIGLIIFSLLHYFVWYILHEKGKLYISVTLLLLCDVFQGYTRFFHIIFETVIIKYNSIMDSNWDDFGVYEYYINFLSDTCLLIISIFDNILLLYENGIHLTAFCFLIVATTKQLISDLYKRITSCIRYNKAMKMLNNSFNDATREELIAYNDNCAICFNELKSAKKLNCNHLFHMSCLRQWLERMNYQNDQCCPICRAPLYGEIQPQPPQQQQPNNNNQPIQPVEPANNIQPANIQLPANDNNNENEINATVVVEENNNHGLNFIRNNVHLQQPQQQQEPPPQPQQQQQQPPPPQVEEQQEEALNLFMQRNINNFLNCILYIYIYINSIS